MANFISRWLERDEPATIDLDLQLLIQRWRNRQHSDQLIAACLMSAAADLDRRQKPLPPSQGA